MTDKKCLLPFFFLFSVFCMTITQSFAQDTHRKENRLEVEYVKNFEVFTTLVNLTDLWEKIHSILPEAEEARNRFLPFKDHNAVKMTAEFYNKGWYFGFINIALCITDFPEAEISNLASLEKLNIITKNRPKEFIENYLSAVRDFYEKSGFEEFWKEKYDFYEELKADLDAKIKGIDIVNIIENFYGMKKHKYFIIPCPNIFDTATNALITSEGKEYAYYLQGPLVAEKGPNYFTPKTELVCTAFHEFGHTFINPMLNRKRELVNKTSYLYQELKQRMYKEGYMNWYAVISENIIRATEVLLMKKAFDIKISEIVLNKYVRRGFTLVPILSEIITEYEENRNLYTNFEIFLTVLFNRLDDKLKQK